MTNKKALILCVLIIAAIATLTTILLFTAASKRKKGKQPYTVDKFSTKDKTNRVHIPVLYINLERSPNRRKFMEDQFREYGIENFRRVDAVDGKLFNNTESGTSNDISFVNKTGKRRKDTGYEIACTLSHVKAIKQAYDNNLGTVLVLEDDASLELMPLWKFDIPQIIANAPSDWNIIQIQHSSDSVDLDYKYIKDMIYRGTAAYVINTDGQRNVLSHVQNNVVTFWDDLEADIYIYETAGINYVLSTPLIITSNEDMNSTIHSKHTKAHIRRSNKIREMHAQKGT